MMGLGLGKLGAVGRALSSLQKLLWPLGAASPGLWIAPRYVASMFSTFLRKEDPCLA